MAKKSFAGRVGSRGREQAPDKDLTIDVEALKPTTAPTPLEEEPARRRGGVKPVQNDRVGKQSLNVYLDKNVKKQVAMLGIELEKNLTELTSEAFNDLFKKYNKPPIA